jgi:putative membrane protein
MIIKLQIPWKRIIQDLKIPMILITLYMASISILDYFLAPSQMFHVPIVIISVPGTVIALLLGFRTNSAYDRWWEARIIWGAIVNDSRTWVRQLLTFVNFEGQSSAEFKKIRQMSLRQIAWNYALTRQLRKQDPAMGLAKFINEAEYKSLEQKINYPNALLYNQARDLKQLFKSKLVDQYQFVQLDATLSRFTDSMGKCERIKNTVFPSSYSLLVDLLIYLWIIFLPFGLIDTIGFVLVPTTVSLAFAFLTIDRIAIYMQDPFENHPTDTPMLALSRTIEINIKQELNIENVPKALAPKNGILM